MASSPAKFDLFHGFGVLNIQNSNSSGWKEVMKMTRNFINGYYVFGAAVTLGALSYSERALATPGNDFSDIAENITESIEELPGLLAALSYLLGLLLGVLGILKIKDHVENPSQTEMKDGAIRLASGGALFALPIVFESMRNTIGSTTFDVGAAELQAVEFRVQ